MCIYLPHDAVKESLGVLGVVHGEFGLLPLQLKLVMSTLKGLLRQDADPVARVPLVDLGDDVCHHEVGLHSHTDPEVAVKVHVELGE